MSKTFPRSRFLAAGFMAFMLTLSGFLLGGIENTVTRSFDVAPGGRLRIETDIGSLEVRAVPGNTVRIEVQREYKSTDRRDAEEAFEKFKLDFEKRGEDVFVRGEYTQRGLSRIWDRMRNKLRVKFLVTVPRVYSTDLKTKGGGISVKDLEGDVDCITSGGSLTFENIRGDISGRTSGGSVQLGDIEGIVDVDTSGGSVAVERVTGDLDVRTSGGGIRIDEAAGSVRAKTSGGSITAHLAEQPDADCRLTTSGGSMTVTLAEGLRFDLDARASGGRVRTDSPLQISGRVDRNSVQGALNGGGPELYLRTSGGSISIKIK